MGAIITILLILFVPVCLLLILIVLLQAGKGGGLSGAFGGVGGAQPFLGARGTADFFSKLTIYLAIAFMSLALILSITYGRIKAPSVKEEPAATVPQTGEATKTLPGSTQGTTGQPQTPAESGKTPPSTK